LSIIMSCQSKKSQRNSPTVCSGAAAGGEDATIIIAPLLARRILSAAEPLSPAAGVSLLLAE
jgi:hypothetical protein